MSYAFMAEPPPPRRRGRINWVLVGGVLALGAIVAAVLMQPATVSDRPNELKTTRVIQPPPPPPPPPPEVTQERPPEPVPSPVPVEQPVDTPPPEAPSSEPTVGDNALTAREGAGPSNYGLVGGDGSGGRIGGRPGGGGNGFAAYGGIAHAAARQAVQADPVLSRGRYSVQLQVRVDAEGRISSVSIIRGTGDARRDARLIEVLTGLQLSQRPPAGLPTMRIELNARRGG
ncbi:hypothetical protein [Brevundimonas sp. GCM10030266]|uniref:hypothetical protein n=1 Tax=Brevundimonas sp. GCM10030266 TaxID=3273386 RepID=UPI00361975FD